MLKALWAGERDPQKLAHCRDRPCQHREAESARALQGNWRAEPLLTLPQAVELSEFYPQQSTACEGQMAAPLRTVGDNREGNTLPSRPRQRKRRATAPRFAARTPLFRLRGVALPASEGLAEHTA